MLEVLMLVTSDLFCSESLNSVKLGFMPALSYITRNMSTLPLANCSKRAPAGGAAAAAPEGVALARPSASPHLPVVGVKSPAAVPGLAR
jgi:hypothetical protein